MNDRDETEEKNVEKTRHTPKESQKDQALSAREKRLREALEESFPASDPPSTTRPGDPTRKKESSESES